MTMTQATSERATLLGTIKKGVQRAPLRVLLYGVEGIGKTTFAAGAPSPIFIGNEDGFGALDVDRFPAPRTWAELEATLSALDREKHEYKTLVIDSLDWIEPLLQESIARANNKPNLEAFGYGKGYVAAVDEGWRPLLSRLAQLSVSRGMHIVLLAHAKVETYSPPDSDSYDRFTLKIDKRASAVVKEWADAVLFANWAGIALVRDDKGRAKKARAIGEKYRALYTSSHTGAFEAKNRYDLPSEMALDWSEFSAGVDRAFDAPKLAAELRELATKVDDATRAKVFAWLDAKKPSASALLEAIQKLRSKVSAADNATTTDNNEKAE